jgi:hypothetical protein
MDSETEVFIEEISDAELERLGDVNAIGKFSTSKCGDVQSC